MKKVASALLLSVLVLAFSGCACCGDPCAPKCAQEVGDKCGSPCR